MLVWFALVLGVSVASPWVQPRALQMVCTAEGAVLMDAGEGAFQAERSHTLDCALCLLANTPPRTPLLFSGPAADTTPVSLLGLAEPILAFHGAPLPARGPPDEA